MSIRHLGFFVAATMALAACGGGDDSAAGNDPAGTSTGGGSDAGATVGKLGDGGAPSPVGASDGGSAPTSGPIRAPTGSGWHEMPNTKIVDQCPNPTTYSDIQGDDGCQGIVSAWGSALADTARSRLVIWGGGHTDYWGNEIYSLELSADPVKMVRLTDPSHGSAIANLSSCPDAYSDGNPAPRHTGGSLEYLPTQDSYFTHGFGLPPCGDFGDGLWMFDPKGASWSEKSPSSNKPNPGENGSFPMHAYDPTSGKIFEVEVNTGVFWSYDPTTNSWSNLANIDGCTNLDGNAVIDPSRDAYICVGGGDAQRISLKSPYTVTNLSFTNCGTLASDDAPGFAFDSTDDKFVAWNGGNDVYTYDPDSDSCSSQTYTGGPGAQQQNGTFGRFRYFPSADVFVLVNDASENAYALHIR